MVLNLCVIAMHWNQYIRSGLLYMFQLTTAVVDKQESITVYLLNCIKTKLFNVILV